MELTAAGLSKNFTSFPIKPEHRFDPAKIVKGECKTSKKIYFFKLVLPSRIGDIDFWPLTGSSFFF